MIFIQSRSLIKTLLEIGTNIIQEKSLFDIFLYIIACAAVKSAADGAGSEVSQRVAISFLYTRFYRTGRNLSASPGAGESTV